jgi:hypothetical protein
VSASRSIPIISASRRRGADAEAACRSLRRPWRGIGAGTLAYIDGFWLCFRIAMVALGFIALITRAPPGPFTPAPFGFAKMVLRKCGVAVA